MRALKMPAFWLSVFVAVPVAQTCMNVAADRLGDRLPALRTLNDYNTRRNG